jgi:hypothetical protein
MHRALAQRGLGSNPRGPGEKWNAVNLALVNGNRGLQGGSSLAKLLSMEKQRKKEG